jgi:hypothetical protein
MPELREESPRGVPGRRAMMRLAQITLMATFAFAQLPVSATWAQVSERGGLDLICPLVEHERQRALEDYELELALVESEYQARKKVFAMVEKLWAVRSIEREVYLDYQRLHDRTKVRAGRAAVRIEQQKSIVEQYQLTCGQVRGETTVGDIQERIESLQRRYRRIDCDLLDKDLEIAEIDYKYDAEVLSSTQTLVANNIKTKFQLVIEEFDLSQSKSRVDGFRRRASACKTRLKD